MSRESCDDRETGETGGKSEIRDAGCGIRDAGYGIRDAGYGIRDAGYGIRDAGYGMPKADLGSRISHPLSPVPPFLLVARHYAISR